MFAITNTANFFELFQQGQDTTLQSLIALNEPGQNLRLRNPVRNVHRRLDLVAEQAHSEPAGGNFLPMTEVFSHHLAYTQALSEFKLQKVEVKFDELVYQAINNLDFQINSANESMKLVNANTYKLNGKRHAVKVNAEDRHAAIQVNLAHLQGGLKQTVDDFDGELHRLITAIQKGDVM